ncbi:hypothetical protein [Bifidobacterium magnum]|uniref:Uncharacterized protein n=1 Tax=Bifidobacterium magnum TaxID=1692 RepID=A0A087BBG6_9BIFI|nr:hypothetical protein [Bifidobacterium magnum]KFI68366.1 hypothetical protein BMAGN_0327 [Bifidobacterium magnum]
MVLCVGTLGGCSVRVEGRAEQEATGLCERAYYAAEDASSYTQSNNPSLVRYIEARQSQHAWLDVAIQCPDRFGEGTMRSAQAQFMAHSLADRLSLAYQPLTVQSLEAVHSDALNIIPSSLAQMALAEDRAGFAAQVLAGRWAANVPQSLNMYGRELAADNAAVLLNWSDDHKETASQLMYFAGTGTQDLRQKVYATQDLTQHDATIVDPATGIESNTLSVVEMNAARAELEAMNSNTYPTAAHADSTQVQTNLVQISMLIATHMYRAFELGYPNVDGLLYAPETRRS